MIPEEVYDVFNDLIAKNLYGKQATVRQSDIIGSICSKMGLCRGDINMKWLNVESTYESKGWKVEYNKPGYNESYEATFTFSYK